MTLVQPAFLAVATLCLLMSLAACVAVLCEPGLRFKPVWVPFCFVGMGGGALVWEAPDQIYWFFGIAWPTVSFSMVEGGWRPELIRFLFPIGAAAAVLRLYWHRRHGAPAADDPRATS